MKAAMFVALLAACGTPAMAQVRSVTAPVPIVLPRPPAAVNGTATALLDAMLAIGRAQQNNPQAAQTAAFQYVQAVQQYRIGNIAGANASALQALSIAGAAAVPRVAPAAPATPNAGEAAAQLPGTAGGLYGGDAPAIDADSFLALARGLLGDCAARHDRRLAGAQRHLAQAQQDYTARDWQATRRDAKAAIDACAAAQPANSSPARGLKE